MKPKHATLLAALAVTTSVHAQSGGAQGPSGLAPGVTREQMWYAPTAEDWKKPCMIQWQRSYEDALAVSRETGKPVLVCVNMDGEIASEHYAGVRYRQADIAALYEPYICVIASVYRHNPRDHDEQGRRIVCPRFGTVTCGEHIAIEPGLYDQFMDGRRIAPRHIGVETHSRPGTPDVKDGKKEMYDVFYAWDTDTIFSSLKKGIAERQGIEIKPLRGDRTIVERVDSADSHDKEAVELTYEKGDRAARRELLAAAFAAGDRSPHDAPVDLLRLAMFDLDVELSRLARQGLAKSNSESAIDLINDALRVPMEAAEREALIAALVRIGEKSPRARTLAVVHQGLNNKSSSVDVEGWARALDGAAPTAAERDAAELDAKLEYQVKAVNGRPDDSEARIALAEMTLDHAMNVNAHVKNKRVELQDARRAALEAEKLGATGWRVNTALALSAYYLGELDEAHKRSEAAVAALPGEPQGWRAIAVLALFAEARQQQITKALRERQPWPPQWLTDVHAAHTVLSRHPLGTDYHVAQHYDFLRQLGAAAQASRALDAGLDRFPDSWILHDRLRGRILAEKGAAGLEPAYEAMLAVKGMNPGLEWYAGYASLVAAEFHRRANDATRALDAYNRAIAHYELSIGANPSSRDTADHYIALGLAGRAKLAFERADYEASVADLLASFARKPEAAASLDGLNLSPVDTAKLVRVRLTELKQITLLMKLQAALDALDPSMLLLPAYESEDPAAGLADSRPGSRPGGRPASRPSSRPGRRGR